MMATTYMPLTFFSRAVEKYQEVGAIGFALAATIFLFKTGSAFLTDTVAVTRGHRTLTVEKVSISVNVDSRSDSSMVRYLKRNEMFVLEDFINELSEDDIFYDIGANIGVYGLIAAPCVGGQNIYVFEPYAPNAVQIRENSSLNDTPLNLVTVGLSNEDGVTTFDNPADSDSKGRVSIATDGATGNVIPVMQLDTLLSTSDLPSPSVVKIDVEGAEQLVLEGMTETLQDDALRCIYCEVHLPDKGLNSITQYDGDYEQVIEILESAGFGVSVLQDDGATAILKAIR